jgi:hypothetical protein
VNKENEGKMQNTKAVVYISPSEKFEFTVGTNNVRRIYADENFINIYFENGAYRRFFNTPYEIEGLTV